MHSNKAAVNKVCFISFHVKCITENQNTQHLQSDVLRVHSCSCFLTWLYLEAFPVPLCYWWYILPTEDMSTVLWRVCATNAAVTVKRGMNSRGCRSVKCLHASSLNLVSADIKASIHTCLWGVWGSGFPQSSVKCWMHLHHQANTEEKLLMCNLQGTFPPVWALMERHGIYQQSEFHSFYVTKGKFCL